jgi:hypothetical protein
MIEDALRLVGMPEAEEREFRAVAEGFGMSPSDLLRLLARRVVESERWLRQYEIGSVASWATGARRKQELADDSLRVLPLDIKERWCLWPVDSPFPWSAVECRAAVLGYEVRWPLGLAEFNLLPGKWELLDGYARLFQPG